LVFAAPAVGAPDIARSIVKAFEHGLCVVGGDVCNAEDARRAKLAPCPLKSDTTGAEASVTAFSVEIGGKWQLTITPQSDGTVSVVRTAAGSTGVTFGGGFDIPLGRASGSVAARLRVQGARGWTFPDKATADRFLEHAVRNDFDEQHWPWTWESGEVANEGSASGGVALGIEGAKERLDLLIASVAAQAAIGQRVTRDGIITTYSRVAFEAPELSVPLVLAPIGAGRSEWIVEYSHDHAGRPVELAFRTALPSKHGSRVTDTVARLDLRDPANLESARPFLTSQEPWSSVAGGASKQAVLDRIATHGTIERSVSDIHDDTKGMSLSLSGGWKFGVGGKHVKVRKTLVSATVQRGTLVGKRLDCVPAAG
jgi:hypothetical protein